MKLRLNGRLEIENLHGYPEPLLHSANTCARV